ncbi:MAG TPA: hypothetical protein PKY82_10095 [Pyrinomonadaceae bacterium]|nr:hypothetical protein [Pyrinomonadaceae bacterium]
MKAFSCPQCGALLQDVSIEKNIARCEYCRAKILIRPIGEIKLESEQEYEISLVTRAEGREEDEEKEIYTRGKMTFSKPKYHANESLAEIFRNKKPRKIGYLPFLLGFGIIIILGFAIYFNLR